MNYSSDRPIENCDQDLLGRAAFSKQLGKALFEYKSSDGLVIGLYGKWGTGKTSVINMAINEVNSLATEDNSKPLIIRFMPWNYSDKNNLISLFFQKLKKSIDYQDNEDFKKKVGEALSDYADAFDVLAVIPFWGAGAPVLKELAKASGEKLKNGADLDKTRHKLEQALLNTNKRIIIVIDDIDRLTNSQIRDIFQLVKQVADFPNVIYVLVMDRDVVRSALTEVHNIDGNEYLEKIIQIPFEIPELRKSRLHTILFSKFNQIIQELPLDVKWDQQYWSIVFQYCVSPYINTLRDVNRVINTFQFRYGALYQETAFEDMVGLTTIEVLEPELYKWIRSNKEAVCGGFMHSFLSAQEKKPDYRKQYAEEFASLGLDPDKSIKCVATLFPVFANDVNEHSFGYQDRASIRGRMRVAHEERFDLYFSFDLEDIKVSRSVINDCIYNLDADSIKLIIKEINNQGNIIYFIEELRALVNIVPYNRLDLLASVMIDVQGSFQGEKTKAIFAIPLSDYADFYAQDLLQKLKTEEERFNVVYTAAEHADKHNIGAIARIINRIELSYGRLAGNTEKQEDQIISIEHLQDMEQLFIKKVQDIVAEDDLLDASGFGLIVYLWKSFDREGAQRYITGLFEDDAKKLRFICALAGKWTGTNGCGWSFNSKDYSEYISDEEIYNLIQRYDKQRLQEFAFLDQVKLASFVLNYKKEEVYYANEQKAKELIEDWISS